MLPDSKIIENNNLYIDDFVINSYLQEGEILDFEITPELRQKYFALARIKDWYHLPEFTETDNLPTEPINYWFMLLNDGAVGWDKNGKLILESPWLEYGKIDLDLYFPIIGLDENGWGEYFVISPEEFDNWVNKYFGNVELEHKIYNKCKYYYFDGSNYYNTCSEQFFADYWELTALTAQKQDNRIIYTASLSDYGFHEHFMFNYDETKSFEENMIDYACMVNHAPQRNLPVFSAYGKQLMLNEITMDEAIRKMIISGNTKDFICNRQLTVSYYINEQQEPFYLSVQVYKF